MGCGSSVSMERAEYGPTVGFEKCIQSLTDCAEKRVAMGVAGGWQICARHCCPGEEELGALDRLGSPGKICVVRAVSKALVSACPPAPFVAACPRSAPVIMALTIANAPCCPPPHTDVAYGACFWIYPPPLGVFRLLPAPSIFPVSII